MKTALRNLWRRLVLWVTGGVYIGLPRTIDLTVLYQRASAIGFYFCGTNNDIYIFSKALSDAAAMGRVQLVGRPEEIRGGGFLGFGPRINVAPLHWKLCEVDWISFCQINNDGVVFDLKDHNAWFCSRPRDYRSNEARSTKLFYDLGIYEVHATRWLNEIWLTGTRETMKLAIEAADADPVARPRIIG